MKSGKGLIIRCGLGGKLEQSASTRDPGTVMKFARIVIALVVLAWSLLSAPSAWAQSIKVANAWVRAPAPGQKTAIAYADLTSAENAALVAAGSPVAERVELHSMTMDGGVMRMRALPRIELPAGQTVKLAPGGAMHVMLVELKQPLKPGDKVPLVLSVQSSGMSLTTVKIEAEVRALAAESHRH
jgi:copper(I)-binding protein